MSAVTDPPGEAPGASPQIRPPCRHRTVLDVVVPVHDEQDNLAACVRRLHAHLTDSFPYSFRITIADNASTDATPVIAAALATELAGVGVVRIEEKGRGGALRTAWSASGATVLAYLDVDLSTDLAALLPLVAPLISGHSDLAIGSRLSRGARVVRGAKREVISRCYNLLLHGTLATRFSDAQCGFKAVRADVAGQLLPLVEDGGWFFDTELLVLAERAGLRIHEVPVDWIDDPDSRVDLLATAMADLHGMVRMGRALVSGALPLDQLRLRLGRAPLVQGVPFGPVGQLMRFGVVGATCTLAYLLLYLALRDPIGAQPANLVALLATAVGNTALNRAFTFGVRGRAGALHHQAQGLVVFAIGLALTSGALALLHAVAVDHLGAEITVLVTANLVATLVRFLLLRSWVFPRARQPLESAAAGSAAAGSAAAAGNVVLERTTR